MLSYIFSTGLHPPHSQHESTNIIKMHQNARATNWILRDQNPEVDFANHNVGDLLYIYIELTGPPSILVFLYFLVIMNLM